MYIAGCNKVSHQSNRRECGEREPAQRYRHNRPARTSDCCWESRRVRTYKTHLYFTFITVRSTREAVNALPNTNSDINIITLIQHIQKSASDDISHRKLEFHVELKHRREAMKGRKLFLT